jgi:dTDP-4-dehydrorhamnose 3,5-epimerase
MNSRPVSSAPGVVVGWDALVSKRSAVDKHGELQRAPIEGLMFRPARPAPHEDGHVTEVARSDWPIVDGPIVQVHITTTYIGRVRAWGLHQFSADRLFVVDGFVRIVVYDGRKNSATFGNINEFAISAKNPGLLFIPPYLYHGWKNIGTTDATIINMPTVMYNHEAPDALDLPWDSEAALELIPYKW